MAEPVYVYEQSLPEGLRYTERVSEPPRGKPVRHCELWSGDEKQPVSDLELLSYRQRFGSVDLPVEGFGGVATRPQQRRKGYVSRLMRRAIERASERVDALFLYGIQQLYPKFGFVSCFCECEMKIDVRDAERAKAAPGIRLLTHEDMEAFCALYNREHAQRSWTVVRQATGHHGWVRATDWNPGESTFGFERGGELQGYAVITAERFGEPEPLRASEIVATSAAAAEALVAELGRRAVERRQASIVVCEPFDSTVGRALRRLGATATLESAADGGGMGVICRRRALVERLRPELERRAGRDQPEAIEALARGGLYPDGMLLRLLLGSHSWRDALDLGHPLPEGRADLARAWFPGSGPVLPLPYTHPADRY